MQIIISCSIMDINQALSAVGNFLQQIADDVHVSMRSHVSQTVIALYDNILYLAVKYTYRHLSTECPAFRQFAK